MNTEVMFSSKTDQWATPQAFFDKYNEEFDFVVDVCADESNTKCNTYFSEEDDGLSKDWHKYKRCWMNPPYGREIGKWVKKAYEESKMGGLVVCLLPSRTDTKWFHDYIYNKAEIRFLKGRLKFGDSKNSAPFPSMVVIFRPNET
jgi:phage N-6-adenine-methyltransferase